MLKPGDRYQVAGNAEPYRPLTDLGGKPFIVA